jgi:AraC family transcriptional regulator, transcriptional activator of pobA
MMRTVDASRAFPAGPANPRRDPGGRLAVDRLAASADPVEVVLLDAFAVGGDGDPVRAPHRHDYHELIWVRQGSGRHLLDGREVAVVPGTLTVIGRGQVHVFERARGLTGAVVRFGEALLHQGRIARAEPTWLLAGRGAYSVTVPRAHATTLESIVRALAAEAAAPPDAHSADLQRHLLSVVLVWIERWYDAERTGGRQADDAGVQLFRRFAGVLERDFAAHHEATHYADALAVPPSALSQALSRAAGRTTKELITDRVMLEAARLLRFTDRTIGEISYETGFSDPLYFSRAFKRHHGQSPTAYRDRSRGIDPVA